MLFERDQELKYDISYFFKVTKSFKETVGKLLESKGFSKQDMERFLNAQKDKSSFKKNEEEDVFICDICKETFTTLTKLQVHCDTIHELESEDSSLCERELVIDDDVELLLDDSSGDIPSSRKEIGPIIKNEVISKSRR